MHWWTKVICAQPCNRKLSRFRSKRQCREQKIGSCKILAYFLVHFSNFDPEKAFSGCRVVCVSKMRFSFICKILKMLIMVTTYLHSITAAKVTVAKNRIQSTYIWSFPIRTWSKTRQLRQHLRFCFDFRCVTVANSLFFPAFVSNATDHKRRRWRESDVDESGVLDVTAVVRQEIQIILFYKVISVRATKICREAKAAGGTWFEAASRSLITSYSVRHLCTDVAVLPVFSCN